MRLEGTYPEDHEKVRARTDTVCRNGGCPPSGKGGGTYLGLAARVFTSGRRGRDVEVASRESVEAMAQKLHYKDEPPRPLNQASLIMSSHVKVEGEGANLHRWRATFHIQVLNSTPRERGGSPLIRFHEDTVVTDQTREVYVRRATTVGD